MQTVCIISTGANRAAPSLIVAGKCLGTYCCRPLSLHWLGQQSRSFPYRCWKMSGNVLVQTSFTTSTRANRGAPSLIVNEKSLGTYLVQISFTTLTGPTEPFLPLLLPENVSERIGTDLFHYIDWANRAAPSLIIAGKCLGTYWYRPLSL